MLVTNIERQKNHPHRVNIFLDGKFAFGLHEDSDGSECLKKGDALTKEIIEGMLQREELTLAKERALRFLSYRRRSEKELRTKLLEKEFSPLAIDTVITQLRDLNFLNDDEFAKAFVHDTQLRKPAGKTLLRQQLRMKGIASATIDTVLRENISDNDERALATQEAKKVMKRFSQSRKAIERQKQQQRISQHLARRGFSWQIIVPVVKELFQPHTES